MATYTLKSAVASVTVTSGSSNLSADIFTATGQTVVKSLIANFTFSPSSAAINIQKSGGSAYNLYKFSAFTGNIETIGTNGIFLETGDKLIINCVRDTINVTMVAIASYTVIT